MEYKSEVDDTSSVESGNDLSGLISRLQLQAQELDRKYSRNNDINQSSPSRVDKTRESVEASENVQAHGDDSSDDRNDDYFSTQEGNASLQFLLSSIKQLSNQFNLLTEEMRLDRAILEETRIKVQTAEEYRDMLSENQSAIMDLRARQLQEYFEIATARMKKIEDMIKANASQLPQQSKQMSTSSAARTQSDSAILNSGSSNHVSVSGNSVVSVKPAIVVNPTGNSEGQRPIARYNEPVVINAVLGTGNNINASGNSNVTIAPVLTINVPTSAFTVTATVEPDGTTRTTINMLDSNTANSTSSPPQHCFVSHAPITISGNSIAKKG